MEFIEVSTDELKKISLDIRLKVFVEELEVPIEEEILFEKESISFLCKDKISNNYIGTIRYRELEKDLFRIERLAVLKEYRKNNYGSLIFKYLLDILIKEKKDNLVLHSFPYCQKFYEKFNFKEFSEIRLKNNIRLVKMKFIKND